MKRPAGDETALLVREGCLHIVVAHCVHCDGVTLAPTSDQCDCGAELYPVTKFIPLGVRTQYLRLEE